MRFIDASTIDQAASLIPDTTPLGRAVQFLKAYKDQVNAHSDGWPYWAPPVQAASQLIELVDKQIHWTRVPPMTDAQFKKALTPIKSFMTRRGKAAGMTWPAGF